MRKFTVCLYILKFPLDLLKKKVYNIVEIILKGIFNND